jgi:hypothetical protein
MLFCLFCFFLIIPSQQQHHPAVSRRLRTVFAGRTTRHISSFFHQLSNRSKFASQLARRAYCLTQPLLRVEAKPKEHAFSIKRPPTATMHFPTTTTTLINLLLLTTASLQVLASPLSFTDIERRWSAGETDVSPRTPSTSTSSKLTSPSRHQSTPPITPAPPPPPGHSP